MGFNGNTKCTFIVRTSGQTHHLSLKLTNADYTAFAISFLEWYNIASLGVSGLPTDDDANYYLGKYADAAYLSPLKDMPDTVGVTVAGTTTYQFTGETKFVK